MSEAGDGLRTCPDCGVSGLPERIRSHDCSVFLARAEEIFEGSLMSAERCTITCSGSGRTLREGDEVLVHLQRSRASEHWSKVGTYDTDYGDVRISTNNLPEYDEVLLSGRLAVASDRVTQKSRLVLHDVEICEKYHAE